jgi:tetratricopeptide (TPR) repeat protein
MPAFRAYSILLPIVVSVMLTAPDVLAQSDNPQALDQAEMVYRQQGPGAALPLFEGLAEEFEARGDRRSLARATGYVGEIHWRLGNYGDAEPYLEQALEQHWNYGDRLQEGKTLNVLGLLHWDLGELDAAVSYFRQGSEIAAEVGDRRLAGAILNNLSLVHDEQGDYLVSLEQYQQVLELYEGQDFPRGEGDTLGNMGGVYLILGRYRQALERYRQALEISRQLDSAISLSQDNGNIALAHLGLGDIDQAMQYLDEAIALADSAGMQQDEAYWMRHKGNAMVSVGRHDEGLELHRAALASYDRLEGRTEKIEALYDMAGLYQTLGDLAGAESYYRQSMELAQEVGVSRAVTANLLALGDLQALRGKFDNAAVLYRDAIERARESGEMASWSRGLLLLSEALRGQQKYAAAHEAVQQALELTREIGAAAQEARALFERAELQRLQGEAEDASNSYRQSLALLDNTPDVELEWQVHYGNGLALCDLGETPAAIQSLEIAINIIEGVRNRLEQERFRAGYVQDKYQVYVDLVRLLLEAGKKEAAFSTAERLRSRSYLNLIGSRSLSNPSTADKSLEFELKERIATLRRALAQERSQARPQQRQPAIKVYTHELLDAEQAYQAFLDERGRARPAREPGRVPTYIEVSARLAGDEALLEYVVGPDHVMVFLLTRDNLSTNLISLRRQDLDNKVELLRNLINRC